MTLPARIRAEVESRFGAIRSARGVGGGCINPAVRLDLSGGSIFLKYNERAPAGLFESEADGLRRLAAARTVRVPEVLAVHEAAGAGWLALEWLEPGRPGRGFGERLGQGLARLHGARAAGWGWRRDGFIGSLPQANAPTESWSAFWAARRLEPQLRRARDAGLLPGAPAEWDRLLTRLPELLAEAEAEGPSPLHGDLWSGNVLATGAGEPALVDPAFYHGHREVDLAMSELFGGFPPDFLAAYEAEAPLAPGYREVRRAVYQLYYLLVHVNLFGPGYAAQTVAVLRQVLARS